LVKFYADRIKFHTLIVIYEFCYILQKTLSQRILYRMFFMGGNFVSSLICTLKCKKPKINFLKPKNFFKHLGFFQPWFEPFL